MKKKILSIITSIILVTCFSLNVFAQESHEARADMSLAEVVKAETGDEGITIALIRNDDGSYSSYEIASETSFYTAYSEGIDGVIDWAVFHLGFKDWNDDGDLYYTITADEPLSYIQGYVYIKSTDILFPKTYLGRSFSNELWGSQNTSRFLSQNVDVGGDSSVRVGFSGVTITAISGDTASIPNNSKVVYQ